MPCDNLLEACYTAREDRAEAAESALAPRPLRVIGHASGHDQMRASFERRIGAEQIVAPAFVYPNKCQMRG